MDKVVPDEVKRLLLSLQQNRARAYAAAGHPLDTHGHIHLEQDALAKYHGMLRTVQAEIIAPYGDTVNAVDFIAAAPDCFEVLDALLEMYVDLANSGDCGNWDPEKMPEVISARAAIAKAKGA